MTERDSSTRREPTLSALLHGLADTLKEQLVPIAESRFLHDQLSSLANILRILATEGPQLASQLREDHGDLRQTLARLSDLGGQSLDHAAPTESGAMRAAAARNLRDLDRNATTERSARALATIREYIARDLKRPYAALFEQDFASSPARGPHEGRTVDEHGMRAALSAYLEAQLREALHDPEARLTLAGEASEGYAAETRVCELATSSGTRLLVARIQWPHRPLTRLLQPLEIQAALMRLAREAALPVPSVLLAIDDLRKSPAPVLVTEHVKGYTPTPWSRDGQQFMRRLQQSAPARRFVETLVSLHALGSAAHGLNGLTDGSSLIGHHLARVRQWESLYRQNALRADPLVEEVLSYLQTQARVWGDVVLVHNDYRPGNIIYDPDSLDMLAIIDWDGARLADHHEELGRLVTWAFRGREGYAAGLMPDEVLLEIYAELSGRDVDPIGLRYYELLSTFQRYLAFSLLARSWLDQGGDVRMARAWLALKNDRVQLGRLLDLC